MTHLVKAGFFPNLDDHFEAIERRIEVGRPMSKRKTLKDLSHARFAPFGGSLEA